MAALKGLHRADIVRECNSLKTFSPLCDKQVITSGRVAFWDAFENTSELILNCPRAHAIIYTKHGLISLTQLTTGVLIGQRFMAYCTDKLGRIITGNHVSYDEGLKFDHSIRIFGFIN